MEKTNNFNYNYKTYVIENIVTLLKQKGAVSKYNHSFDFFGFYSQKKLSIEYLSQSGFDNKGRSIEELVNHKDTYLADFINLMHDLEKL